MTVYRVYDQATDEYVAIAADSVDDAVRQYVTDYPPDLTVDEADDGDESLALFPVTLWRDEVSKGSVTIGYEDWLAEMLTMEWRGL